MSNFPCRKFQYPSYKLALEDGQRIAKKTTFLGKINAYFCTNCNSYHFTRKENKHESKITELEQEIIRLKEANKLLIAKNKKEIELETNVDKRIKAINQTLVTKVQTIKKLRDEIRDLVTKMLKLEREKELKTS